MAVSKIGTPGNKPMEDENTAAKIAAENQARADSIASQETAAAAFGGSLTPQQLKDFSYNTYRPNVTSALAQSIIGGAAPATQPPATTQPKDNPEPTNTAAHQQISSEVDAPDIEDMQSRLQAIIDKNSPLMKQAQAAGLRHANSRGTLNSSMAGQAAQEAIIGRAIDIATPDYNVQAALATQKMQQDQNLETLGHENYFNQQMRDKEFGQQKYLQGEEFNQNLSMQANEFERNKFLTQMQAEQDLVLQGVIDANKAIFQNNQAAIDMERDIRAQIGAVIMNDEIPYNTKPNIINDLHDSFQADVGIIASFEANKAAGGGAIDNGMPISNDIFLKSDEDIDAVKANVAAMMGLTIEEYDKMLEDIRNSELGK